MVLRRSRIIPTFAPNIQANKENGKRRYWFSICPLSLTGSRAGSKDTMGNVNFMLVAYVGIVCHHHLTLSLHKTKTLENILATKKVSINLINDKMLAAAYYCGGVSGNKVDKSGVFEMPSYKYIHTGDIAGECIKSFVFG